MGREVFCPEIVESCYMCWTGCQFCNYGYVSEETANKIKEEKERNKRKGDK